MGNLMARGSRTKLVGILILLFAFFIAVFESLAITKFVISDTDSASYIVVVLLMFFLAILFSAKKDIRLDRANLGKNAAIAIALFIVYVLLEMYLRVYLSFVFMTYRIDLLLLPIAVLSFIILLFGKAGLRKMIFLPVYLIFASPIVLMPVLNLSNAFADFNAYLVFFMFKGLGMHIAKTGLVITAASSSSISIASTCADIGIFAAMIMFLAPVAYLYNGRFKDKAYWMLAGVLLMLLLNILRMVGIGLVWAYVGIDSAVATLHLFVGEILFDIDIVVMILLAPKFGLVVPRIKTKGLMKLGLVADERRFAALAGTVVIGLAVIALLLSVQEGSNLNVSPAYFSYSGNTVGNYSVYLSYIASLEPSRMNITGLNFSDGVGTFSLTNGSYHGNDSIFALVSYENAPLPGRAVGSFSKVYAESADLLNNGISVTYAKVESLNKTFYVSYFSAPVNVSGRYVTLNYELFALNSGSAKCSGAAASWQNAISSGFYNMLHGYFNYGGASTNSLECVANRLAENFGVKNEI
ncbi:exosortase/archaeosortase family protein [Candidatus Marsarchaeota archaeon]|nr:exosortase/archaeosortase family protein [Candidatus Marsarchaeota archaeon]